MNTPAVSDIAAALESALQTIPGLRTWPYLPDDFTPPAALVHIDQVVYHGALANADVVHRFTVFIITGRASERTAQKTLQSYMSQAGNSGSVIGALEADKTLGGVVSTLLVEHSGPVSPITLDGSVVYLSVPFSVLVHA